MSLPVQSYDNVRAHLKAALESAKLAKHSVDNGDEFWLSSDFEAIITQLEETIIDVDDRQRQARLEASATARELDRREQADKDMFIGPPPGPRFGS